MINDENESDLNHWLIRCITLFAYMSINCIIFFLFLLKTMIKNVLYCEIFLLLLQTILLGYRNIKLNLFDLSFINKIFEFKLMST